MGSKVGFLGNHHKGKNRQGGGKLKRMRGGGDGGRQSKDLLENRLNCKLQLQLSGTDHPEEFCILS